LGIHEERVSDGSIFTKPKSLLKLFELWPVDEKSGTPSRRNFFKIESSAGLSSHSTIRIPSITHRTWPWERESLEIFCSMIIKNI
jgi:hypothetical protein